MDNSEGITEREARVAEIVLDHMNTHNGWTQAAMVMMGHRMYEMEAMIRDLCLLATDNQEDAGALFIEMVRKYAPGQELDLG